jgi:DNA adenine methylase
MRVNVAPIKSQGIKTQLVPWISSIVPNKFNGRWVEPFMGTGVVAFNLATNYSLLCDINPHLINFYESILKGQITAKTIKDYLVREGALLLENGESHYYYIRGRFNKSHDPLDFLFLNRAGFNGMIRFNRKGEFNIPFCRKPNRFAKAYITKIVNQVLHVQKLLKVKDFSFSCQSFEKTIAGCESKDIIYCDPPYVDRHVDYYNGWDEKQEKLLYDSLSTTKAKFILSTWHHNDYRENRYIKSLWSNFNILTKEHFYHVGGKEKNRNSMIEAIITNYDMPLYKTKNIIKQDQLMLFSNKQ